MSFTVHRKCIDAQTREKIKKWKSNNHKYGVYEESHHETNSLTEITINLP